MIDTDIQKYLREYFWLLKAFGYIVVYAIIAIVLYSYVAAHSIRPPTTLFTPIDHSIPFISAFAIFYVFIFYPFLIYSLAYFWMIRTEKSDQLFVALLIMYLICYVIYIVFPVMMIRPSPQELPNDFLSRVMAKYYEKDPPLNCFPSLHAALSSIIAYFWSKERPQYKCAFWAIAVLVMISTLFVRQHVIVDEIAGFMVAILSGYIAEKKIRPAEPIQKHYTLRMILGVGIATLIVIISIAVYIP